MKNIICILQLVFSIGVGQASVIQKRQTENYCNACHNELSMCQRYPFKSKEDQMEFQLWALCMAGPFENWKKEIQSQGDTTVWPDLSRLVQGEVRPTKMDRRRCFDDTKEREQCMLCGMEFPLASIQLEDAARDCVRKVKTMGSLLFKGGLGPSLMKPPGVVADQPRINSDPSILQEIPNRWAENYPTRQGSFRNDIMDK